MVSRQNTKHQADKITTEVKQTTTASSKQTNKCQAD